MVFDGDKELKMGWGAVLGTATPRLSSVLLLMQADATHRRIKPKNNLISYLNLG
ncbi:Hypothetical protein I595_901 [Croceitalea dokdonensis DOKDO 023]|uniref:Uncharacterized protein n=1 Tax=Croceitalea dokdonensis DOKDO 023 TaxID=1300341 RepID=A0A0P7AV77_9FLAO|nr:Hypothetical protein I595_901 [Croceitalea dokdonensis DOKDO 023]